MREIKFRAWDKVNKRMLYFSDLAMFEEYDLLYFRRGILNVPFDGLELMQYTGRKDKNSKEIYEGDIIEYGYGFGNKLIKGVVEWNDDYCGFSPFCEYDIDCQCFVRVTEIIGNIYQNKELLAERR